MVVFRFLSAVLLSAGLAVPALADGQIEFVLPSGNVGCIYTPKGGSDVYQPVDGGPDLSCDRVEPKLCAHHSRARRENGFVMSRSRLEVY